MGSIAIPNTFSASTTISSSAVNSNFNTIYNEFNGSIEAPNLANDAVTTSKILDNNVTTDKIAAGAITSTELDTSVGGIGGEWQSWAPTYNNLTIGNGTVVSRYTQVGKTVHFIFEFTLGSTSAVAGSAEFSLPVTIASEWDFRAIIGMGFYNDSTAADYMGYLKQGASNHARMMVTVVNASYPLEANISSTVPFTFAVNDVITFSGVFEAA
jgi:hypothetical protein